MPPSWSTILFRSGIASWEQLERGIGVTRLGRLRAGVKKLFHAGIATWEQLHSAVNPPAELYLTMATFNHVLLETLHMPTQVYDMNRWWSCRWRWMVSHCISSLINKWFPTVCYTSCRLMLPSYCSGMNEPYVDLTSRFEKTNSTVEFCTTKLLSPRRRFDAKMSRCGNYHRPPSRVQDIYWFPCFLREQSCSGLQILNLP